MIGKPVAASNATSGAIPPEQVVPVEPQRRQAAHDQEQANIPTTMPRPISRTTSGMRFRVQSATREANTATVAMTASAAKVSGIHARVTLARSCARMAACLRVAALLADIGDGLFQQAFVVADLDAAEDAMRTSLGCDEFVNLPASDLEYELRGRRVTCAIDLGFARSGNLQIELLRPVHGEGLHVEFLASNGPGLHHFGFLVDDLEAVVDRQPRRRASLE